MSDEIILKRDCEAVLIPAGTKITLQAGEPVVITQALGGSYTVVIHGNMARIDARDADAIGQAPPAAATAETAAAPDSAAVTESKCWKNCAPVTIRKSRSTSSISAWFMICKSSPAGRRKPGRNQNDPDRARLRHGAGLQQDVETKVSAIPGVKEAGVFLVWDPPWSREMLSEAARLELGMM
jgi:hypothetical protein